MPPAKETGGNGADIQALLTLLTCCGELNLDTKELATAFVIARRDNATRKIKQTLERHGYKLENKRVTKIDGDKAGDRTAGETPAKKKPAKKVKASKTESDGSDASVIETPAKARAKAAAKKRRLDDVIIGGEVMKDAGVKAEGEEAMEVDSEEEAV